MNQKPAGEPIENHHAAAALRRNDGTLRTSWFDCVTSLLAAVMLLLGTLVCLLAIVWVLSDQAATRLDRTRYPSVSLGATRSIRLEPDFLQPGSEEVEQLREPNMQQTITAVGDAASRLALSDRADAFPLSAHRGHGGDRDARRPGPAGIVDVVPRFQRWTLEFSARDLPSYAWQLDHHGIELGVIGGGVQGVDYADHLSTGPRLRRGPAADESRLYLMWTRDGGLVQFDRQLLLRAGAKLGGREILKFVPQTLEKHLARIELEYAMSRGYTSPRSIAKTVFTSQSAGDGYQFVVRDQRYRKQNDGSLVLGRLSP